MNISILISRPLFSKMEIQQLEKLGELHILDAQKLSTSEVLDLVPNVEILVTGPSGVNNISEELLRGLKKLKFIATLSVGYDWIDIKVAEELGIKISTIKGANSEAVAEHTWGMILDLSKRITEFNRDVFLKGEYRFGKYSGVEVYGKTIGIIGLGNIGQKVARIARGFDMKILGINQRKLPVEGVELVSLETLIQESDVIAVCVPLNSETNNMIDKEEISKMKKGVVVVNCSREEAVNKQAIVEGVQSGKIFGYGVETEIMKPVLSDDLYLSHPRILVTPHNAFNTIDADKKSNVLMIQNIKRFLEGEPQNLIF